jgi:hypothetical protein
MLVLPSANSRLRCSGAVTARYTVFVPPENSANTRFRRDHRFGANARASSAVPRTNSVRTVGRCADALSGFFRTAAGRIRWNVKRSNSQLHATAAAAANIVAKTSPARFRLAIMARLLA